MAIAEPNAAHIGIAALEIKYNVTIVTQNIDDLHERAGSSNILHLHGEIFKMRSCEDENLVSEIKGDINLGDMCADNAQLRPHIVWFEEAVPMMPRAASVMAGADIFILIGTSLQVYPAAGLMDFVEDDVPKYIIDKRIPPVKNYRNIIAMEKSATEGVGELLKILL